MCYLISNVRVKRLVLFAGLAVLLPSLASAGDNRRAHAYTQPHVLRYATAEDITGLNQDLAQQAVVNYLSQLTAAWLFRFDKNNRPLPELATVVPTKANGGVSADGKTITYHLRRNVKWADGAPFSAQDVKFSFDVVNNKANNVTSRDGFDLITKIDTPDAATVVVRLREPYSLFIPTFFTTAGANPCVLPKHLLGSLPNINQAPYNNLPVGIGPFKYVAWHRGENVQMEANPLYWRGAPKLKKIVFKIIPDRNTVLTQLQTGELDLWNPFGGSFLSRVRALPNVTIGRHAVFSFNHFDLNTSRPALREKSVRQALRYAIDRITIRDKVGHGVGILQDSVLPAPYPGNPKLPLVAYDISRANKLLDAAGWKRGTDGVRQKAGVRLSLEFASSTGSPDVDTQLELVRVDWQQIGVEMSVKRYQSSQLFAQYAEGGILNTGKFDVLAYGTGVGPVNGLGAFDCHLVPPAGQNTTRYCNRQVQRLIADFKTRYDLAGQTRDLTEAVKLIVDDVPTIVTTSREDLFAYNSDLREFRPNNVTFFDDMMNVDI
ncbi:MAG: peptide ABC transporter substrate-binding protein [Vulcanimicrobiaceae bacterium]